MRFVLAALLLSPTTAFAGGWTQPEGQLYLKIWQRSLVGNAAFAANGDVVELPDVFIDQLTQIYAEVGLLDALTLVLNAAPLGYAAMGDDSTTYVGAMGLGLRTGVALGETRLAVQANYSYAPDVGEESIAEGVADGEPFVYVPTVKTQAIQGEMQLGQPLSFGWLSFSAGYRWHSRDGLDPAITGMGQIGWNATPTLTPDFHLNVWEPLGEVDATNVSGAGQTRYLGFGLGLSWWFAERWALHGGFEGVAYAYSNASTPTVTVGIEHKGRVW